MVVTVLDVVMSAKNVKEHLIEVQNEQQNVIMSRVIGVMAGVTVIKMRSVHLRYCKMTYVILPVTMRNATMTIVNALTRDDPDATSMNVPNAKMNSHIYLTEQISFLNRKSLRLYEQTQNLLIQRDYNVFAIYDAQERSFQTRIYVPRNLLEFAK